MAFLKKIFLWGCLAAVSYILLSYHFVFINKHLKLLKKSKYTLEYTFFSTAGKTPKVILDVDQLRNDGIAELLVDTGWLTEERKEVLMSRYEGDSD